MDKKIKELLEFFNDALKESMGDGGDIAICEIKVNGLEYYYDEKLNKVKLAINVTNNINDSIKDYEPFKLALNSLNQTISDNFNEEFTGEKFQKIADDFMKSYEENNN